MSKNWKSYERGKQTHRRIVNNISKRLKDRSIIMYYDIIQKWKKEC